MSSAVLQKDGSFRGGPSTPTPFWDDKAREIWNWVENNCARRNLGSAVSENGLIHLLKSQLKRGREKPETRAIAWQHIVLELEASCAGSGDFHKLWVTKVTNTVDWRRTLRPKPLEADGASTARPVSPITDGEEIFEKSKLPELPTLNLETTTDGGSKSDRRAHFLQVFKQQQDSTADVVPQRPQTASSVSGRGKSPPRKNQSPPRKNQNIVEMSQQERQAHCQEKKTASLTLQRQLSVDKEMSEIKEKPTINANARRLSASSPVDGEHFTTPSVKQHPKMMKRKNSSKMKMKKAASMMVILSTDQEQRSSTDKEERSSSAAASARRRCTLSDIPITVVEPPPRRASDSASASSLQLPVEDEAAAVPAPLEEEPPPKKKLSFTSVDGDKASYRLHHADEIAPSSIYRKRGKSDGVSLVVGTGLDGKELILRVLFDLEIFKDEDKAHYYLRDHHPDIYRPALTD